MNSIREIYENMIDLPFDHIEIDNNNISYPEYNLTRCYYDSENYELLFGISIHTEDKDYFSLTRNGIVDLFIHNIDLNYNHVDYLEYMSRCIKIDNFLK